MSLGRAFAVAFGLALVVLGYVFVGWRSTVRDRTASVLQALIAVLSVSIWAGMGTFWLGLTKPNALIGAGMAIYCYTTAVKRGFLFWHRLGRTCPVSKLAAMFRLCSLGNLVAACTCGIGCVRYGGPIGALGSFGALYWALLQLWLLKCFTPNEAARQS